MKSLLLAASLVISGPEMASTDVQKIQNYVSHTCQLEAESQAMHSEMMHAMFGYIATKTRTDLQAFSVDYEQDNGVLKRLMRVAAPVLNDKLAQALMWKSVSDDRAWGANARTELRQMLQIGKTLTTSQYFALTKEEDTHGSALSTQSNIYTFAALKAEGLTPGKIESVMLQAAAASGE